MKAKVIIIVLLLTAVISSALFWGVTSGIVIPEPELDYSAFDTIYERFVIYNNRIYNQYTILRDYPNFTDEYIGTLGEDDTVYKWNSKDYFVELGGNEPGDYYTVKGYPSKYVICLRKENGDLYVFISPYNVRVNRGADVYDRMYNFSLNTDFVYYYNIKRDGGDDACPIKEEKILLRADDHEEIAEFLSELNLLRFTEFDKDSPIRFDSFCMLDIQSENGMKWQLHLCEGGYIYGAFPYCYQKMDEEKFNKFVDFLISMQTEENKTDANDNDWDLIGEIYEDECVSKYMPLYLPDELSLSAYDSNAVYSYDKISGKRNGIQEAYIMFHSGSDKYFIIEINDYKKQFSYDDIPDINLGDISLEYIKNNIKAETDYSNMLTKNKSWFSADIIYQNVAVKYTAIGMTGGEIYEILRSISAG